MPDMLVKLYDLKDESELYKNLKEEEGISIVRVLAPDRLKVLEFVKENFSEHWVGECETSLSSVPSRCYIAVKDKEILGFACYDVTAKGFFGPTGVRRDMRGKNLGRALLAKCMEAMSNDGYGYAIIGWTSVTGFYEKCVGAKVIEDSEPGVYGSMVMMN